MAKLEQKRLKKEKAQKEKEERERKKQELEEAKRKKEEEEKQKKLEEEKQRYVYLLVSLGYEFTNFLDALVCAICSFLVVQVSNVIALLGVIFTILGSNIEK